MTLIVEDNLLTERGALPNSMTGVTIRADQSRLVSSCVMSALHRAFRHPRDDLPLEEHGQEQRRHRDQQDVHEQQVVGGVLLALEVEQGRLDRGVVVPEQEYRALGKSFQMNTDCTTTIVTMIGRSSGNTTRKNRPSGPARR